MQAAVAPPLPRAVGGGHEVIMSGAFSPGAPTTVFVPVVTQPQRQQRGLTPTQKRSMKVLGVIQVTLGALCILISSILIAKEAPSTDQVGAGIWGGVFFILPGVFALIAAATNKVGWIVSTMVMSILSTLILWNVLAFSSASIDSYSRCSWYYYSYYDYCGEKRIGYTAADGLLIAFSLIELIVAIWCAAVCCQSVCCQGGSCCSCCCPDPYGIQISPQMVYYSNVAPLGMNSEQRVVIMSHPVAHGAVGATQHYFVGGQPQVTQPATTYTQQAYGQSYQHQPPAGLSAPPSYYPASGSAAASWATVQPPAAPAAAAAAAVQRDQAEKTYLAAETSYRF